MRPLTLSLLALGAALAGPAQVHPQDVLETPAALVAVSVEIDGRPTSLFPAPDGSGRFYVEARRGCRYAIALASRTSERVGVVLTVDGLNAISGERDTGRGRMYVLEPWQTTSVQGWRTSLHDVRRFTFVDERRSYAARSGKANEKMGWIEVAVYRERRPFVQAVPYSYPYAEPRRPHPLEGQTGDGRGQAPAAPATSPATDEAGAAALPDGEAKLEKRPNQARSYPGTGWGERTHDPVVLVSFDPEPEPRERVTLRYEYRPALVALGVLPPWTWRDRLTERDHAEPGFAQPPRW